jgi:hypothetical protein
MKKPRASTSRRSFSFHAGIWICEPISLGRLVKNSTFECVTYVIRLIVKGKYKKSIKSLSVFVRYLLAISVLTVPSGTLQTVTGDGSPRLRC